VSAFGSGLVIFENVETREGPWHMSELTRHQVLELWKLLDTGDIDSLKKYPWKSGYGGRA
jgi:hypothetical protein